MTVLVRAQQCNLYTCEPTMQQKEMALSLAAAKSLAILRLSTSPLPEGDPAPHPGTLGMPEAGAVSSPALLGGSLAEQDYGECPEA